MPKWIPVKSIRVSHQETSENFTVEVMYNIPTGDNPLEGGEIKIKLPKKEDWIEVTSYLTPEFFGRVPHRVPAEVIAYLKKS